MQRDGSVSKVAGLTLSAALHIGAVAVLLWQTDDPEPMPERTTQAAADPRERIMSVVLLSREEAPPSRPVPPMPEPPRRPTPRQAPPPVPVPVSEPSPIALPAPPPPAPLSIEAPVELAPQPAPVMVAMTTAPSVAAKPAPARRAVDPARAKREQQDYVQALMAWLVRHRVYPDEAKKAKAQGIVQVRFTIDRDGRVLSALIDRSPGIASLEAAALDVLRRANPVPPIPESMGMRKLTITLPIEYSLLTD